MPNIEIKAVCHNFEAARLVADKHKTSHLGVLHQVDTYFNTKSGRLKLREINNKESQLIPYYKDYNKGPMKSMYSVLPSDDPTTLKHILHKTLGTLTVIDKHREVFLINNIRVHLDSVKDLGYFIEFEAVYSQDQEEEGEYQKVQKLMHDFKISQDDLLDKSYIDYLLQKKCDNFLSILFKFSNNEYDLIEVKRLDKPDGSPKKELFFWFLFHKGSCEIMRLKFQSFNNIEGIDIREFDQGVLKIDQNNIILDINDKILRFDYDNNIATDLNNALLQYFQEHK